MLEGRENVQRQLDDAVFVIFGITGDLAKRKLLPALYQLALKELLSERFKIIGVTRRDTKIEDIISSIRDDLRGKKEEVDEPTLERLRTQLTLVHMDITKQDDYLQLKEAVTRAEPVMGTSLHRLFYLAVPPEMFDIIVDGLGKHNLRETSQKSAVENRLLIEKPFGYDTSSAQALIKRMENVFTETEIYRVDHYLAKETAQNLLTFRFKNPLFNAVWDKSTVSHIMITASETIGIEGRVNFYENTGALRDLIQSHLLQLLSLITMEEPEDLSSSAIHKAKLKLLKSIRTIETSQVDQQAVRGQYEGYKKEVSNKDSYTETYAAVHLEINNERWKDVPVLLRSGKAMAQKVTEISLIFETDHQNASEFNALTIRIQPDEGIVLSLLAKKPSLENQTEMVQMEFKYSEAFGTGKPPGSYERVLADSIRGEKTLFTTDQEVLESWRIFENVIKRWSLDHSGLEIYQPGTWGPKNSDKLAERARSRWLTRHLHLSDEE